MFPNYSQSNRQDSYFQDPYARIAQLESIRYPNQYETASVNTPYYLKGRPVVSIEEARAAQIDLDGSIFIFTDIANNKIYTKQINLDGVAVLKTYSLVQNENPTNDFVTKAELNNILFAIKQDFLNENSQRSADLNESTDESQSRATKETVRKQPTF